MNVFIVVSEKLVNVLVEILVDGDDHPLRVHLEEQQEGQDCFTSEHDRLVLEELTDGRLEGVIILQDVVQLWVGLSQGDVYHGQECLLDSLGAFEKSQRELLASQRFKDRGEQSCVQLADVRY